MGISWRLFFNERPKLVSQTQNEKSKQWVTENSPFGNSLIRWQNFFKNLPSPYVSLTPCSYSILWNSKMRTRAGLCYPSHSTIELNPHILKSLEAFESTLVHELCHLVIFRSWPRAEAHGLKWKNLMRHCGFSPERCHRLPAPLKRVHKTWILKCACEKNHEVKTRTFKKITKRPRSYICRECKQFLRVN